MFSPNAYDIRYATAEDAQALRSLAALDGRPEPSGRILIAARAGAPIAAVSLDDGTAIADPFHHTRLPLVLLRIRAGAVAAYERTPALRERVLAGTPAAA